MFVYAFYTCIRTIVNTRLYVLRSSYLSPTTQPDRIKNYPVRPNLYGCRIFIPQGHDGEKTFPLLIRVHGGGFIVNNPSVDDPIARTMADRVNCIVVSIDYCKAPQFKFPGAYEDIVVQSLAVIDDEDLPIDREHVALCGASAGGNLVLAAAQDPRLRSKVIAVAGVYPVVDLVPSGAAKMATRPDPSVPDFIGEETHDSIEGLYFDSADKPALTDVRCSPTYFETRESLPPRVLLIGCEHDMFCHEDEAMADKLAGPDGVKTRTQTGWRAPGVQWHKVPDQAHAFDFFAANDTEREKARPAAMEDMNTVLSEWLTETFSSGVDEQ